MTKKHAVIILFAFMFYCTFTGMVVIGVDMVHATMQSGEGQETDLKLKAASEQVELELKTGLPGIVLIVFGSFGLLLMVIKVPAKEMLQKGISTGHPLKCQGIYIAPKYSDKSTNIPLLLWWLIKRTGWYKREPKKS